jgi:uncharacterized protein
VPASTRSETPNASNPNATHGAALDPRPTRESSTPTPIRIQTPASNWLASTKIGSIEAKDMVACPFMSLTLYIRRDCHLCLAAQQALLAHDPTAHVVDLDDPDTDPLLRAHYDLAVPVLHFDGVEVARGRIDANLLDRLTARKDIAVCVMGKIPRPGKVKTRLIPDLTHEQAAAVHRTLLLAIVHRFQRMAFGKIVLSYDPPIPPSAVWPAIPCPPIMGVHLLPQSPGDLGDRLSSAYSALAPHSVIFLGCDSPDLPVTHADTVVHLLESHDAVLGPTPDGGYWTLAVRAGLPLRDLLHSIPWSSGSEYLATLERFRLNGYRVGVAPEWEDVDHFPDLRRLLDRLGQSQISEDRLLRAELVRSIDGVLP